MKIITKEIDDDTSIKLKIVGLKEGTYEIKFTGGSSNITLNSAIPFSRWIEVFTELREEVLAYQPEEGEFGYKDE